LHLSVYFFPTQGFLVQVLSLRKERQRNLAAWFDPVKQGAALRRVEEEVC
jgi:hypothetical protein